MSYFLNKLLVENIDDNHDKLIESFKYFSERIKDNIIVPNSFTTDYASVPKLPLIFLMFGDTAKKAAVIHDYLYQTHMLNDRKISDEVFLEAMLQCGVPAAKAYPMYWGVRIFGWYIWRKYKDRKECFGNECLIKKKEV